LTDDHPKEINLILAIKIEIIASLLRFVEEGKFRTCEKALKVLISPVRKGSITQLPSSGTEL
jgi:hypothetical protein